jgi:uncharacterized UBP type Zn finger protein
VPETVTGADRAALDLVVGEAFVDTFRWIALISAGCALAGAVAMLTLRRSALRDGADDGATAIPSCVHLDEIVEVAPSARGCVECLRSGDSWVHLRVCLSCGHVGCCDSSKNRHATAHFWRTRHPIVQSLEAGEDWRWCYIDEAAV